MSEYTISLAFSVWHHYLKQFTEKHQISLPIFPEQLKKVDISHFLPKAEEIVLGKLPEIHQDNEKLFSLFEHINQEIEKSQFFYDFKPLSPNSIFPTKDVKGTDFSILWQQFVKAVENDIPISHRNNLSLWLDHFDTAMQCFTCNLPSPYSNEISFYDFTKAVAAFAVALADEKADKENPFLLIQGDFFGIQDFIFSGGSESNKGAAKILRGRSFQVSLFTELAALNILNACKLPTTSQMMNAAGKFLIVAPNTAEVKNAINQVQTELNQWFIKETYGLIGLGIAIQPAKSSEFEQANYEKLVKKLFENLEEQKLKRLDLTDTTQSVQEVEYPNGVCKMNSFFPAQMGKEYSLISEDQIKIGEMLAKKQRIIIADINAEINHQYETQILKLPIFGFKVIFTNSREDTKEFGYPVKLLQIYRFWDFSLPKDTNTPIWNGYARRYINAYVPFNEERKIVAFEDIQTKDEGQKALMTLKGDVDNLGTIFQKGIKPANIAKMAALSRQMNQFFSLWLPAYCAENSPNMYTVFAGGDDFFLIGPWHSTQKVAYAMQHAFARYVAENPEIHFSVGMVMSKSNIPVPRLGDLAEEALEKSKGIDKGEKVSTAEGKNAVTIFNRSVKWADWKQLCDLEEEIHRLAETYKVSTSYLYSLIRLCEQAADEKNIESTMWRSRFYYRTARYVTDKLPKENRNKALSEMSISLGDKGIGSYKLNFAIPLTNYFYQKR
ncbi:type III-A CRISPR-associated protein Cas10/Csm1 [Haemophilus parahaemolyticus]|uniref:type III-A CRISPR-associated protein Cas10/Csm1 n=1 Tax=Haemophilus parahaemolyticus TaxID=735 RepID=UPI000DAE1B81|nr:type III-A CRISPR-associated protein Cas10/Csm1 [Haemophilus parahaemolyticus]RDE79573.1 type III-A CRISPR-associated protein Cas10/Csm1 [Haemophilus parahaemolyticus]